MRDAGLEVVEETARRRRQVRFEPFDELIPRQTRQRRRGSSIRGVGECLHFAPLLLRHFALQVADPMRQAPLPQAAREDFLDGADQARRTVRHDEQRINEAARLQIAQKLLARDRVFLGAGQKPQ